MQRYYGAVAGIKQIYKSLPPDHIIQVKSDGTEAGTYNNAVSALSQIPSDGVVLMTAVNDEVTHGLYKAAGARHLKNYLVNSFGGDPFGLAAGLRRPHALRGRALPAARDLGLVGPRGHPRADQRNLVPEGSGHQGQAGQREVARDRLQVRADLGPAQTRAAHCGWTGHCPVHPGASSGRVRARRIGRPIGHSMVTA